MEAVSFPLVDCLPEDLLLVVQEEQEPGVLDSCLSLQAVGGSTVIFDFF